MSSVVRGGGQCWISFNSSKREKKEDLNRIKQSESHTVLGIQAYYPLMILDTSFLIACCSPGAELETINSRVGLMCCMGSIIFCAAPLISLTEVFRTQCTEVLPFPLILSTFLVTGLWWLYGIIIQNTFVQYPNLIGCGLASFQLLLFIVYPSKRKGNWPWFMCRQAGKNILPFLWSFWFLSSILYPSKGIVTGLNSCLPHCHFLLLHEKRKSYWAWCAFVDVTLIRN